VDRASAAKRMGRILKSNLDDLIEDTHQDWDTFIIVIGKLGIGKSTLEHLILFYFDDTYDINRVVFTKEQFDKLKVKLKKYQGMGIDELINIFFSGDATTTDTRDATKDFHKIRGKNFFIVGCVDDIFSLTRWVSKERPTAVLRVVRRGIVEGYDEEKIRKIRIDTQRNVIFPEPNFIDYFKPIPKSDPFWKEYAKKKETYTFKKKDENPKLVKMRKKISKKLQNSLTVREAANIQHVVINTIHGWLAQGVFLKKDVFMDSSGRRRITIKGFESAMKRLEKKRARKKMLSSLRKKTRLKHRKNGKKARKKQI